MSFRVDEDVTRAETPPGELYCDPAIFARVRDRVFARAWQWIADADGLGAPGQRPATLGEEPLVVTRDAAGELRCLSNVCTHRANLVCAEEGAAPSLRCGYHGRRFGLDGSFHSMPEFAGAREFPRPCDNLPQVPLGRLGPLLFAALEPALPFERFIAPVAARLDLDGPLVFDPASSRDYEVAANWALYCDNYLEGFHIPYVHPELSANLDYGAYRTELLDQGTLQVGVAAAEDEPAFDALEEGRRVAGYYYWLFPATMFNVYPWGLSLNLVTPLAVDRTRVSFRSYVADASRRGRGAGAALDLVERQDEAVVESVQRGVRSRLYRRGRYSPARESGVHHFHRLLLAALE